MKGVYTMSTEPIGLEFLQANEIKNKTCDMTRPFAFISYSHDKYDAQIAMNLFRKLYDRGLNIWIDTANMDYDENDWTESATKALMNHNCKFAFFFRSESSLLKDTIRTELSTIKRLKHIKRILTIDIWHNSEMQADTFLNNVLNDGDYDTYSICREICEIIKPGCKAFRLAADFGNNLPKLADALYNQAIDNGLFNQKQDDPINPNIVMEEVTPLQTSNPTLEKIQSNETNNTHSPSLHGSYTVQDLVKNYNDKTFTAKLFGTVGLRIAKHPQYTVAASKTLAQLTLAFVDLCIKEQGEDYIHMVNQKKKNWKNPVFVPSTEKNNYNVTYTTLKNHPSWSLNTNYSPFGHLKNLNSRLIELDIDPADAELIFDEDVAVPSVEKTTAPVAKSTAQPTSFNEPQGLRDAMYQWMDSYASHQGGMNGEHPLYQLICNQIPSLLSSTSSMQKDYYTCKGSCGQGNWAGCPWIAIFNTNITSTTTKGVYIVYLLNAENKTLYLTLDQGMTAIKDEADALSNNTKQYFKEHGYRGKDSYVLSTLADNAQKIQRCLDLGSFSTEAITSGKAEYDAGCICSKKYTLDTLPSDEELYADLENMLNVYATYYERVFKQNN